MPLKTERFGYRRPAMTVITTRQSMPVSAMWIYRNTGMTVRENTRLRFWPLQLWITVQKTHRRRPDILRDIPTGAVPPPGTAWQRRERMLNQRAPLPKGLWMKAERPWLRRQWREAWLC